MSAATLPPLFVYGTLRRASGHPMAARLRREAVSLGPASVRGRLWQVAHYPGLRLGGARPVRGDLFRLRSGESLGWLDAYEGCGAGDPRPHIYARVTVGVRWRGRTMRALVYLWIAPVRGRAGVASGDWLRVARRRCQRAAQ